MCGPALAGRFDEAEQLAHSSVRLAEHAPRLAAGCTLTAQLLAVRREQGRLRELLPEIERCASDEAPAAAWRGVLPLAYLGAGDRDRARATLRPGARGRTRRCLHDALAHGDERAGRGAAELRDPEGSAALHAALEPYADLLIQWSFTGAGLRAPGAGPHRGRRRPPRPGAHSLRRPRSGGAALGADASRAYAM